MDAWFNLIEMKWNGLVLTVSLFWERLLWRDYNLHESSNGTLSFS